MTAARIPLLKTVILLCVLLLSKEAMAAQSPQAKLSASGDRVCTANERWLFDNSAIKPDTVQVFENFLGKRLQPVQGFAEAMALRKTAGSAESNEMKFFAEYWISRSLLEGKLVHIAYNGFVSIVSRPLTPETAGVQLAALECLEQIYYQYPAVSLPADLGPKMEEYLNYATAFKKKEVVWQSTGILFRSKIADETPSQQYYNSIIKLLAGSGVHENFAKALWAAKQAKHKETVALLEKFLRNTSIPPSLKRYVDYAQIILARSYYALGEFDQASSHLKLVSKSSNELAESLSELSWSYLQEGSYPEAIGTAMNLQAGGLRHTFAPEAPMVMAMALNEICQYPESVKAINIFRKNYEKPYDWLRANPSLNSTSEGYYPLAVQYLRKKGTVPERIASEWVRSPLFISNQNEINLLFDEKDFTVKLSHSGAHEQKKLEQDILKNAHELTMKLRSTRKNLQPGQDLPQKLVEKLAELKRNIIHYARLQRAAPKWRTILASYNRRAPQMEGKLIASINQDLSKKTRRMHMQIEEIAENLQLVEVEIYNGASQDIIWQNAHPDYKEAAKKMSDDHQQATADKVWDWGHAPVSNDEYAEVWEDELGSFKANLYDNCSSKDRFLSIRLAGANRKTAGGSNE